MRDNGRKLKQEKKSWIYGSQAVKQAAHRAVQFLTILGDCTQVQKVLNKMI